MNDAEKPRGLSFRGVAIIGTAVGAVAVGAFAIGVLAIGRLAVRHFAIESAKLKSLEIEELSVKRLRAVKVTVSDSIELPESNAGRDSSRETCFAESSSKNAHTRRQVVANSLESGPAHTPASTTLN